MRKIKLIVVGSLSEQFKSLAYHYEKNINIFSKLELIEIKEQSQIKNVEEKKFRETNLILQHINQNSQTYLLSLNGKSIDSLEFSNLIKLNHNLTFIIGGSDGVNEKILNNFSKISFSKLTFPHQLFRIMLSEQIYRSFMIINNKKYHK
ncbi:23S rRNA (pseudouridine(1915)-N(3))-methyltransferase RlmH [Mycoplasma sp. 744]|uniref:23S rRNA (pseudouridine(1915)-N(3))-methyltransferase RlmH n=1 Tax=Mycoplasma sp. 744 TaxID=3108531 RepID=UPI002B1E5FAB|nr:23S rRNA (pseudouridine(1915)-N(3))-methyltransferase RlmH [Mycoplasma sp. 744]MEA4115297.1 23S rRNA (pseudouridine(1915)-N(3))-methyltransferase RlmH [Mycoplasma sp. 744]